MKIKALDSSIRSMKLIVPVDGLIEIDVNGIADVSQKCGEMLIKGTNDWGEYSETKPLETDNNDAEGTDIHSADDLDVEIIDGLKKLSLEECIDAVKQANYPEKEWKKFLKNDKVAEKLMRNYLITKYKDSIK